MRYVCLTYLALQPGLESLCGMSIPHNSCKCAGYLLIILFIFHYNIHNFLMLTAYLSANVKALWMNTDLF